MTSTNRNARIAGFLYLLLVIVGPLRLMYIPNTLFVHGNASATITSPCTRRSSVSASSETCSAGSL